MQQRRWNQLRQKNMAAAEGYRFTEVTPHDHQAWLWIVTSMSLTYAFVTLGMRLIIKWKLYALDDLVLIAAYVSSHTLYSRRPATHPNRRRYLVWRIGRQCMLLSTMVSGKTRRSSPSPRLGEHRR